MPVKRRARCPADGGFLPIIATFPAPREESIHFVWCKHCLLLSAYVEQAQEKPLMVIATYGYNPETRGAWLWEDRSGSPYYLDLVLSLLRQRPPLPIP